MIGAKEHAGMEMTSEDDDDEPGSSSVIAADVDNGAEERRLFNEKNKRSVRRKTHSPKRVQKGPPQEMPILDERYAASLLEYYSKHKPYYPVSETEFNKQVESEVAMVISFNDYTINETPKSNNNLSSM